MAQFNSLLVTGDSRFINPINGNARNGVYYVKGTQTAATGSWTGAIPVPALYDGLTISYYLPYAGSGNATLNLTLSDGTTTGAVNCYYQGNSRLTTHYGAGSNIMLTYHPAGAVSVSGTATTDNRWVAGQNSDSNDQAFQVRDYYNRFVAGSNKVFPYTIIMQNADGRWESIVTSSSTGTSKARNTHGFRLGQIALMYYNATYNENAILGDATVWESYTSGLVDHRYSFNTANDSTHGTTANKPVYLVGGINASDGLFYLDTTWWTQTLPSTDDGKLYIYLGDAYDHYRMSFRIHHPVYCYTNGKIRQFAQDSATVSGHTVAKNVPSSAVFTDRSVNRTNSTDNSDLRVLLTTEADDANTTGAVHKSSKLTFNPSIGNLQVTTLNGYIPTGVWVGTQAQYDAIATPDTNVTYYITDGYAPPTPNAGVIGYSNTSSGLSATTVQGAIDETAGVINNNKVKSVMLTTSVTSTYSDGATIGYRGTGPNINTLTGYPTGKNILCAYVEYSYVSGATYPALSHIVNNVIYVSSKSSGSVTVGVRVLYTETT